MKTCGECAWIGRTIESDGCEAGYCRRVPFGSLRALMPGGSEVSYTQGLVMPTTDACPAFQEKENDHSSNSSMASGRE